MQEPIDWPTALFSAEDLLQLSWYPLAYSVFVDPEARHYGRVAWRADHPHSVAGIAWDWAEVGPSVLAIDNPLAVESNIELKVELGSDSSDYLLLRSLHLIIHGLPWQGELLRQITS